LAIYEGLFKVYYKLVGIQLSVNNMQFGIELDGCHETWQLKSTRLDDGKGKNKGQ
jgi:hypothetical protein